MTWFPCATAEVSCRRQRQHRSSHPSTCVGKPQQQIRLFVFRQVVLYRAKELLDLFRHTGWQIKPQHARIVESKVRLFSPRHPYCQEMPEVLAKILERLLGSQENAPTLAPTLLHQLPEQRGLRRQAHQVSRKV